MAQPVAPVRTRIRRGTAALLAAVMAAGFFTGCSAGDAEA